jgi:hypothetical protein
MAVKRCKNCNAELENNEKVCPFCGQYQKFNYMRRLLLVGVIVLTIFVLWLWFNTA